MAASSAASSQPRRPSPIGRGDALFDMPRVSQTAEKARGTGRPPREALPALCVDAPVLEKPRAHRAHCALVPGRELLQRAAGVERREQLAVLLLAPRLAGLRRHLQLSPVEAL